MNPTSSPLPNMPDTAAIPPATEADTPAVRKRLAPGERRAQILQALAAMLEQPGAERITTAALAARLDVSEAALYRHFASKAQMFDALIEFIEQSVFGMVGQVTAREADPAVQAHRIVTLLLQFAQKNPGLARVMVGDALVHEHERLQQRMNLLFDKLEAALRQCLRESDSAARSRDAQACAAVLTAFVMGRLARYVHTDFRSPPIQQLDECLQQMLLF